MTAIVDQITIGDVIIATLDGNPTLSLDLSIAPGSVGVQLKNGGTPANIFFNANGGTHDWTTFTRL